MIHAPLTTTRGTALAATAAAALALLVTLEISGARATISAAYAQQVASGQLARDIAHRGGVFLHKLVMSLITHTR